MIGDVLVSSILINNLKKAYPNAQIDYMVYESTITVLDGNPNIDNIVLFTNEHRKSKLAFYRLIQKVKKTNYDIVIDPYSKLESWITVFFLKKSRRISYKKWGRTFLYTDNIDLLNFPKTNLGLIIERRLSLLNPLQLDVEIDPFPKIYVSENEIEQANNLFKEHDIDSNKKTVMVSIIGSSDIKTLPLREMSRVIDFIVDNSDCNILFNYVPNQIQIAKQILDGCKSITKKNIYFNVLGKNLREFIAIMNKCDVIIGNDGGAINMAKALNKPSFIIFSPWIEKKMWSTFEDGEFHKSVHLNDYRPEFFENQSRKQLKKKSIELYKQFKLTQFSNELKKFIYDNIVHPKDNSVPKMSNVVLNEVKLSVLVITYNEVDNVDDLIDSVCFADEILVVDSFSTDGTVEAFRKHKNVKFIQHEFSNFSDQRNFAISQAKNDWILFVDADERVSLELQKEIHTTLNSPIKAVAFGFYRKFYFNGNLLRFGGYQSEKVYRLFHKEYATYDTKKLVHELLKINGESELLKKKLDHYSYSSDEDFKNKLNKYGKLRAEELYIKKLKPLFYHFYLKPAYRFFHLYIIRFGILDGEKGRKMALLSAYGVKQRYVELKKIYNNAKN